MARVLSKISAGIVAIFSSIMLLGAIIDFVLTFSAVDCTIFIFFAVPYALSLYYLTRNVTSRPKERADVSAKQQGTPLNPYKNKYSVSEIGLDNVVYLLYCDYSEAFRWIKDSTNPDTYFSCYQKAILILEALNSFKYTFAEPVPASQIETLQNDYESYTKKFIIRYWNATMKETKKLKTLSGREKRIKTFFDTLNNYADHMTPSLLSYIETLKSKRESIELEKIDSIVCGKYTLATFEDINSIPNSDTEAIYALQKTATEFKRSGQIDLAIACLKKSNTICEASSEDAPLPSEKQLLRLVKYLRSAGRNEEAQAEEDHIYEKYPAFLDKRISNRPNIARALQSANEWHEDLILVTTSRLCPICKKYNNRVFSISGKSKKYSKLPAKITSEGGFCPDCYVGMHIFFDGISTPPKST